MAPKQSGETRTPAVGPMTRWYSKREAALAGGSNGEGIVDTVGVCVCEVFLVKLTCMAVYKLLQICELGQRNWEQVLLLM